MYRTLNPTTEELIQSFDSHNNTQIDSALQGSITGFSQWKQMSFAKRAQFFYQAATQLETRASELSYLITLEMGKPIAQAKAEIEKCALVCRYCAENAEEALKTEKRELAMGGSALVRLDPLGPVFAIMPWNFPFYQVFRFVAPALMAGNTAIIKHAPNTPQCALEIESIFFKSDFPAGVYQSLFLTNEQAAEVIADNRIAGVTLTGSERAGRQVAKTAGANLKRMVMELGGSDPFIVLRDANLEKTAAAGATSRCFNSGQVCCAAKRFVVEEAVFEDFTERFSQEMESQVVGDPQDPKTTLGPLARADLKENLMSQVQETITKGARVISKVAISKDKGYFVGPMVLVDVPADSPAIKDELFGPVAVIIPAADEREAIEIANNTRYGLSASIWTADQEKGIRLSQKIDAGTVAINRIVTSDPVVPFGGVKCSGFGRELAIEGMREFVNVKAVWT